MEASPPDAAHDRDEASALLHVSLEPAAAHLEHSYCKLLTLAAPAVFNQAAQPLAALVTVGMVGHAPCGADAPSEGGPIPCTSLHMLAAFTAVTATIGFVMGIFNFLVTVTWAQLGKVAIGEQKWSEVGPRVRVAVAVAGLAGMGCATLLWAFRSPIFASMDLDPGVLRLCELFFSWRLATIVPIFLQQTAFGVLGAYQRIYVLSTLNSVLAGLEVATVWVVLYMMEAGLSGLGQAGMVLSVGSAILTWAAAILLPPPVAEGQIHLCTGCGRRQATQPLPVSDDRVVLQEQEHGQQRGAEEDEGEEEDQDVATTDVTGEYLGSARDMMLRSLCLTASIYAMAVCSSRVGPESLAAHQILISLWTLSSYICDGFADVGTMLGAADVGAGRSIAVLSRRLLVLGFSTGVICAVAMATFQDQLAAAFTHEREVHRQLEIVWPILVLMQPCNAMVFVYDGLMLALQIWGYIRNLMAFTTLGLFAPVLVLIYGFLPGYKQTLLAVWVSKCFLNVGRCVGSAWRVSWRGNEAISTASAATTTQV